MADQIRPTPQSPILGSLASALRRAQEFTGQYQVDPRIPLLGGTSVDEMLSLPGAASLVEDVSYYGPRALIRGGNAATGGIGTFKLDPRVLDLAEVGANVAPLAQIAGKVGKSGAKVVGQELNRAILDSSGPLAKLVPQAAKPMYAVKPKGGNWAPTIGAKDNVEASIQPMKRNTELEDWQVAEGNKNAAMNKWLDTKLQKYIRNDMGTPDDPIRLAHEEGYSHFPGNPAGDYGAWLPDETATMRRKAGYPEQGFALKKYEDAGYPADMEANTRKAELWENLADTEIKSSPAAAYQDQWRMARDFPSIIGNSKQALSMAERNPWIEKLDPETPIYKLDIPLEINSTLGFGHMTDELENMLNPASGLPANLRLTPAQLEKVTVKQMVEKVDAVNKWRAAEAAKAELAGMSGNLTATPRLQDPTTQLSFVEKPGMTWVDIPSTTDEAAKKYCTTIGRQAGWCTQGDSLAKSYGSGENRLTTMLDAEGRPHVQAMLTENARRDPISDKFRELDQPIMDDIRAAAQAADPRGIDWGPQGKFLNQDEADLRRDLIRAETLKRFPEWAELKAPVDITELKPVGNAFNSDRANEYAKRDPKYQAKITDSVLNFLNSGKWGRVKDLDIYGVTDLTDPSSVQSAMLDVLDQVPPRDRVALFNQAIDLNPEANRFMSRSQFREFVDPDFAKQQGPAKAGNLGDTELMSHQDAWNYLRDIDPARANNFMDNAPPRGFFTEEDLGKYAAGGSVSVYDPTKIDEIINGINEPRGYAKGGSVRMAQGGSVSVYDSDRVDAIANQFM